jgi:hypothetical protein
MRRSHPCSQSISVWLLGVTLSSLGGDDALGDEQLRLSL